MDKLAVTHRPQLIDEAAQQGEALREQAAERRVFFTAFGGIQFDWLVHMAPYPFACSLCQGRRLRQSLGRIRTYWDGALALDQ